MSYNPINHIALLVPSVEKAAEVARQAGLPVGPTEEFEGEGTREVYVGDPNHSTLLLFIEPFREGPYSRALVKRGPGLHHIAIDVLDVESFADGLSDTGWLLHPRSLYTIKETQTLWLARPSMPMLIEVQQRKKIETKPLFIQHMTMGLDRENLRLLEALGVNQITSIAKEHALEFATTKIEVRKFW